ncbi:MAG: hypothetical protein IM638_08460 [Bacteroidetes bacterium]|nr:hypothetical protein [Bacteroidota bacterium]
MKNRYLAFMLLCVVAAAVHCAQPVSNASVPDHTLRLKWMKAYPDEHWAQVREGLRWTFSFLGANLPQGSFDKAIPVNDSLGFVLDLSQLGFSAPALTVLDSIITKIKTGEEYRKAGSIDLSRFVVLLIGVSENYYAITGAEKTLNAFIKKHQLEKPLQFGVTRSAVAAHHRLVEFNGDTSDVLNFAFLAVESEGDLEKGTFSANVFEAFDIMPNGQLRFSVYDAKGNLIAGSPKHLGEAGKPAKCLWCHEIHIAGLFVPNTAVNGMLSNDKFTAWRNAFQRNLDKYRNTLKDDLDYSKTQDHTFMELLYISFMEPSLMRLSSEWQLSPSAAQQKMGAAPDHVYEEFPHLGELYYRYYADSVAGVKELNVPVSVREYLGEK